jgi:oligopeptide/dipeptide ABC transporter ATP-binding protein
MLQRAMIAMAIALNPRLLIADEPTTALDVTVQAQILQLLHRLQKELGMALLIITHDLGVVSNIADDVIVMYAGKVMEQGSRRDILIRPHHPYTRGLIQSLPRSGAGEIALVPIRGQPPAATALPLGCPFHPRCDFALPQSLDEQPLYVVDGDPSHRSACWLPSRPAT